MKNANVILSASQVYGVDHGAIYYRGGDTVAPVQPIDGVGAVQHGVYVRGMNPGDFAVFASLIDDNGAVDVPFLVVSTWAQSSLMIPAQTVENDTITYGTSELAHKFQTVGFDEIQQFGLASLYHELAARYPLR